MCSVTNSFRPPSVPLISVDPYFSVWSAADRLYDQHTVHWTNKRHSMAGIIRIDGKSRRFMGKVEMADETANEETPVLEQQSLKVEPLITTYVFEGDGIQLEVNFTTPLLLDDLDVLSRPVSYMTFRVHSVDGEPHDVQVYVDISGELARNTPDQLLSWFRTELNDNITAMFMGTKEQPVLQRIGDDTRIDWGYAYLVSQQSENVHTAIGSYQIRRQFIEKGCLPPKDADSSTNDAATDIPVMACVIDFAQVDDRQKSHYVIAAYDDIHSIEYFGKPLPAYWRREGTSFEDMLSLAVTEYEEIHDRCTAFNRQLIQESIEAGGDKYADLLSLAYRQAIAAHKLVCDENGEILFLSKENFSNGCIATVDVSYPSIPLFLRYNPELVKGMMRPIFRYANSPSWTFDFAPHDVGCYPKANGQVYGENKLEYQMPIEECGNMLIMAASVCLYEGRADFAREHWDLLTKWAAYLKENGLDPDNQLCTDDFAGHLAHNANLSIKAIVGIGAYAALCSMLGEKDASVYSNHAQQMASDWETLAYANDHYKLTFDSSEESWSLKYNLVWDRLFGLNLFSASIREQEMEYYKVQQHKYGTPLDSRNTYTKADWLVWCASMANSKADFEQMIQPLWLVFHESASRVPLTDWYDTITGNQMNFQNRSVVGGFFIQLLHPTTWKPAAIAETKVGRS
ncbi:glutaminase [Paenibacillus selenitireducens]|uniref:Glutaminase n=1 Tax=Paenibacillus selenitireducens TaxID=1324314 RepID=A0A1T2XKX3_9BACL|nr:glutaminase family protein [Paenibacillus selenitireducens]OPA80521.1 glutaminase [Paenibacillus selenitireducens]